MGKSKHTKEKRFDRNVEISAPILDPEIIKAIHTPPKGQRLDIKHGGFKALLSDLNSQDSTDELTPLNDNHVPSYIGISCAVSGYSNYSPYNRRPPQSPVAATSQQATGGGTVPNGGIGGRSRATSPVLHRIEPQINHITIDKNNIQSVDQERKELTEKLSASASERQRSPSPCIPPTEDDRHHGTYVGARYCPLPPPDKLVNKHIPLLGIDDDQNPDEAVKSEEENTKVEQRIASLYGGDFVEDWRESMTHKAKKELADDQTLNSIQSVKSPKDLVTLKPTPPQPPKEDVAAAKAQEKEEIDLPTPNAKVLASVEKQFLNKLLSDDNPPMPTQPHSPPPKTPTPSKTIETTTVIREEIAPLKHPEQQVEALTDKQIEVCKNEPEICKLEPATVALDEMEQKPQPKLTPVALSPEPEKTVASETVVSHEQQSSPVGMDLLGDDDEPMSLLPVTDHGDEEHIEYEIRANSPIDNESSPVKLPSTHTIENELNEEADEQVEAELVCQMAEANLKQKEKEDEGMKAATECVVDSKSTTASDSNDGLYYLGLLEKERSFIAEQVAKSESILAKDGVEMDEDTEGRVRSVIGKANLLINKKFNQFKELCEANINKKEDEQFATLNDDLAGFWDMLEIQVSDVRKSFETLWIAEKNNWNTGNDPISDDNQTQEAGASKEKSSAGKPIKLSAQKDQERRERLQEHIKLTKQNQASAIALDEEEEKVDDDSA